jgi:Zn-dependent protease
MDQFNLLQKIVLWGIPLLFAVTVHEAAHGWLANKLGDSTARLLGRITLNPIKHIDWLGTIILPGLLIYLGGFIFGWAKPVPVNWDNLKSPKRDMALVALAGPTSNVLMALLWAGIAKMGFYLLTVQKIQPAFALYFMGMLGIYINILLGLLNLLPLPPLDGSRVLSSFLPPRWAYSYAKIEPYGFFILFGLLFLGVLNKLLIPAVAEVTHLIYVLFQLPLI